MKKKVKYIVWLGCCQLICSLEKKNFVYQSQWDINGWQALVAKTTENDSLITVACLGVLVYGLHRALRLNVCKSRPTTFLKTRKQ